jgi:hypothetical protein
LPRRRRRCKRAGAGGFQTFLPRLAELDVLHLIAFASELILWLEITDPATRETAMAAPAADLRNEAVIERVRLAISFGVEFDRETSGRS